MNELRKQFTETIRPVLAKELGFDNVLAAPKVTKITANIGAGASKKDPNILDIMEETLAKITGQKPMRKKARKAIAGFEIREGQVVGMSVTLRGDRMYDFLQKLVHITLPRVRDFKGISKKAVDGQGNLSIGFKEHTAFPEIDVRKVDVIHGLQVVMTTSADTHDEGVALFSALGMPFKKQQDEDEDEEALELTKKKNKKEKKGKNGSDAKSNTQ